MQATVSAYDPPTRGGRVLLDDGVEMPFSEQALAAGRLRLLRPGQRVQVEVDVASSTVTRLRILTLPD